MCQRLSPRFEFYEINDFLQEERKKEAISELKKLIEENVGMGILYQLYECAVDFADKEEERRHVKDLFPREIIGTFNIIRYISGVLNERMDNNLVESIFVENGFNLNDYKVDYYG